VPNSKPTAKPITVKLDCQLGRALREYKKATKLPPAEIVYRALVCYWAKQKTKAGAEALNTAELLTDEAWAAYLDDGAQP
jgi:hypothetical protein